MTLYVKVIDHSITVNSTIGVTQIEISSLFQNPKTFINRIEPLLTTDNFPGAGEIYL
jgi:hypothetical protein